MFTPKLLASIADAAAEDAGGVAVSGSHGGVYAAAIASRAGLRAVVFNDAGQGFEAAGVAGVAALDKVGMAAAAADCMTCRIGSAEDAYAHGLISVANAAARALGVTPGMRVSDAAALMAAAPEPHGALPPIEEARAEVALDGLEPLVLCVDSSSLVRPEDAGRLIVNGSHGGLVGGDPARALKAAARFASFNDAGVGKDRSGVSRLPALDTLGVAAATVAHDSCRIGDARSALESGVVSAVNAAAAALGVAVGMPLVDGLAAAARNG